MKTAKPFLFKTASKTVTRNIHTVLKDSQLSLSGFEKATGLSRSTLRRIEDARKYKLPYNPTMRTLLKIAKATGLTIDDVVTQKVVTAQ